MRYADDAIGCWAFPFAIGCGPGCDGPPGNCANKSIVLNIPKRQWNGNANESSSSLAMQIPRTCRNRDGDVWYITSPSWQ